MSKSKPLTIEVKAGELRIAIGVDILAHAIASRAEWTDAKGPRLTVRDAQRFAELMALELQKEAEDGDNQIAQLLDEIADGAIESGDACCDWRDEEK